MHVTVLKDLSFLLSTDTHSYLSLVTLKSNYSICWHQYCLFILRLLLNIASNPTLATLKE